MVINHKVDESSSYLLVTLVLEHASFYIILTSYISIIIIHASHDDPYSTAHSKRRKRSLMRACIACQRFMERGQMALPESLLRYHSLIAYLRQMYFSPIMRSSRLPPLLVDQPLSDRGSITHILQIRKY